MGLLLSKILHKPSNIHVVTIEGSIGGDSIEIEKQDDQIRIQSKFLKAARWVTSMPEGFNVEHISDKTMSRAIFKAVNKKDMKAFKAFFSAFNDRLSYNKKRTILLALCKNGLFEYAPDSLKKDVAPEKAFIYAGAASCDWTTLCLIMDWIQDNKCEFRKISPYILVEPLKKGAWDVASLLIVLFNLKHTVSIYAEVVLWLDTKHKRAEDINFILSHPNARRIALCTLYDALSRDRSKLIANYLNCGLISIDELVHIKQRLMKPKF